MLADVEALVTLLSNGQADITLLPLFYADVMNGLDAGNWHTSATPVTFTAYQTSINLPSTLLNIITLIYDDTVLSSLSLRDLETLNFGWRNVKGKPIAYTLESETSKTAEIFPTPTQTSPPIIPVHGLPVGLDYAPGNGMVIMSEARTVELPYLTLYFALKILAREYLRESDHTDAQMAGLCDNLGNLILGMLA